MGVQKMKLSPPSSEASCIAHTPRLNVHGDNGLGSNLRLGLLLGTVGSQTLFTDTGSLSVILLVVGAEQVDIVIILLSGGSLGGVQGDCSDIRAVDGVRLTGITGEAGEVILEGGDVSVPAGSVGVLAGVGGRLQSLEAGNISLGSTIAAREKKRLVNDSEKCRFVMLDCQNVQPMSIRGGPSQTQAHPVNMRS